MSLLLKLQAILIILITISYFLIHFWIIPTYVKQANRDMAASYTDYAYGGITTILTTEAIIYSIAATPTVGGKRLDFLR
jgi:hypothetical protein